jgi:2-polyprenyl-3-methyl-5-hydroxy-6-metoxy-1,4-benzoquinol methylase
LRRLKEFLFEFNTERLPDLDIGSMLEVGCASGAFLYKMAHNGWKVHGIERSKIAAMAAQKEGLQVFPGTLEEAPDPGTKFDLIVGWMVLEHLHDPVESLIRLRSWARPGGWLVVSVPNADSREFQIFRDKWYALQLPTHLFHFTPRTIQQVLRAGGWSATKIYHQRVLTNLIASTGYVVREAGLLRVGERLIDFAESGRRWHYALFPVAWLLSLFGQTGRMTVFARAD